MHCCVVPSGLGRKPRRLSSPETRRNAEGFTSTLQFPRFQQMEQLHSVDSIALAILFLGIEFEVQEPAELHAALQVIADRLERSIARSQVQRGRA